MKIDLNKHFEKHYINNFNLLKPNTMINTPQINSLLRLLRILTIVIVITTTEGCYHTRVLTSHNDPSTSYNKKTINILFWGLVQKNVIATDCDALKIKSLDEVRVTTNFGYALITVITLGIWCPMQVEWKCPKPCPREGGI